MPGYSGRPCEGIPLIGQLASVCAFPSLPGAVRAFAMRTFNGDKLAGEHTSIKTSSRPGRTVDPSITQHPVSRLAKNHGIIPWSVAPLSPLGARPPLLRLHLLVITSHQIIPYQLILSFNNLHVPGYMNCHLLLSVILDNDNCNFLNSPSGSSRRSNHRSCSALSLRYPANAPILATSSVGTSFA